MFKSDFVFSIFIFRFFIGMNVMTYVKIRYTCCFLLNKIRRWNRLKKTFNLNMIPIYVIFYSIKNNSQHGTKSRFFVNLLKLLISLQFYTTANGTFIAKFVSVGNFHASVRHGKLTSSKSNI